MNDFSALIRLKKTHSINRTGRTAIFVLTKPQPAPRIKRPVDRPKPAEQEATQE